MRWPRSAVLFVVDGLRPDGLQHAHTPNIDSILGSGACTFQAKTTMPTITLPCMVSMFLGTGPDRHGIATNTWAPARQIPSIVDLVHSAGRSTAAFYNWEPLRDLSMPGSLDASYFRRSYHAPQGDTEIAEGAASYLSNRSTDFAFVYLGYTDMAGHDYGWMTDSYLKAVSNADAGIGKVLDALRRAGVLEHTFLIVTSDHGGHEKTHGTNMPEDMIVPWVVSGPGVPSGVSIAHSVSIVDTAPTIAALLRLGPLEEWTGRVIREVAQGI